MTSSITSSGLSVGAITAEAPKRDALALDLMRIPLQGLTQPETAIRTVLDIHPAIEVIDEPYGISHEAVPFEALILTGHSYFADSLRHTLPRYFDPLSYRRLDFTIQTLPARAQSGPSVLFGTLIDPGLGAPRGNVQLAAPGQSRPLQTPVWPDGPGHSPMRWRSNQRHAVIALADGPQADGLVRPAEPCVLAANSAKDSAVVIRPNSAGAVAELRSLAPLQDRVAPVLGPIRAEAQMRCLDGFEVFSADLGPDGPSILVVPDSAFSRFISTPRPGVDLLEIRGLFLPPISKRGPVAAAAVRFATGRALCAHGLSPEIDRLLMLGNRGNFLQKNGAALRKLGREGPAGALGLRLTSARKLQPTAPRGWTALFAEDAQPLGWIPLRLGAPSLRCALRVAASPLIYTRTRWFDRCDTQGEAAGIMADWLDEAVHLIVRDGDGGTECQGLARYIAGLPQKALTAFAGGLRFDSGALEVTSRAGHERLRDGQDFRLGPLWVRLLKAKEPDQ